MSRLSYLTLFALALAFAGGAWAQQAGAPGAPTAKHLHKPDPQQQLDRMTKQLQLTPDQQSKILPILQQRDQQLESLHNDTSMKPADRRSKVMSIMQDANQQIDGVLTDPQRAKAKAMREKAMERMEEHHDHHDHHMPAAASSSGGG